MDPLLLQPGALIEATGDLIGIEMGSGKESVIFSGEMFMYMDVQPSIRGIGHYRFKILAEQFIFVEAKLDQFKKWFRVVYRPDW